MKNWHIGLIIFGITMSVISIYFLLKNKGKVDELKSKLEKSPVGDVLGLWKDDKLHLKKYSSGDKVKSLQHGLNMNILVHNLNNPENEIDIASLEEDSKFGGVTEGILEKFYFKKEVDEFLYKDITGIYAS